MPGSKHSVLGIIQVTIDKIIVSITGFTTIDHRGTIALDEKLLNPTISQVTGSRINIKGKKGILDPVNNCQSICNYSAKAKVIKSRLVLSDEFQYCIKRGLPVLPGRVCDGVQRMEGIGAGVRTEAT